MQNLVVFSVFFFGFEAKIFRRWKLNTNDECQIPSSPTKKLGESLQTDHFLFECIKREDNFVSWEPISCFEHFREKNWNLTLQSGESAYFSNGTVQIHCLPFAGAVRKVTEAVSGCYHEDIVYAIGEKWIEVNEHKKNVGKVQMECVKGENGYFEKKVIGCVTEDSESSENSEVITEIGEFHVESTEITKKCVESTEGRLEFIPALPEELTCHVENVTHPQGKWTDKERAAVFECKLGKVHKIGCSIDGISISLYEKTQLSFDCVFMCHPAANIYMCEQPLDWMKVKEEKH